MSESKYHPLLVFLFSVFIFLPALGFQPIHYDDVELIYGQAHVLGDWKNIFRAFIAPLWPGDHGNTPIYYRPINSAYLVLVSWLTQVNAGESFWIHYLGSIVLHATASTLLFATLTALHFSALLALFLSLLFAAHPIAAPVVGWLMGYSDSLLAVFSFASVLSLISILKQNRVGISLLQFFLVFAAAASKENGILLPLALFFLIPKDRIRNFRLLYLSWALGIGLYFVLRNYSTAPISKSAFVDIRGWWSTFSTLIPSTVMGVRKVLFPFFPFPRTMPTPHVIDFVIGMAVILSLLSVIRKSNQQKSPFIFGIVWFICFYFPSLYRPETIPYSETILREDRLYTASFGLFLILGTLMKSISITPKTLSIGGASLFLLLVYTEFHLQHYSTRFKFWSASTLGNQLAISRVHLGDTYTESGDFKKALELYDEAVRLNPKQRMVHNNRGVVYMRLNQYPEAEQAFLQEMGIEPYQALAMLNLASLKKKQNQIETARNLLNQLIEIHPRYLPGYQQLIMLLLDQKEFTDAKKTAQKFESTVGAKVPAQIWMMIQEGLTSSGKGQ